MDALDSIRTCQVGADAIDHSVDFSCSQNRPPVAPYPVLMTRKVDQ